MYGAGFMRHIYALWIPTFMHARCMVTNMMKPQQANPQHGHDEKVYNNRGTRAPGRASRARTPAGGGS